MANKQINRIKSISEFHQFKGLPKPQHPLISIVDIRQLECITQMSSKKWIYDFYYISIHHGLNATIRYGQQQYDFGDGVMFFISPNQLFEVEPLSEDESHSGWILLIHPDFIWNTPLAKTIRQYEYFDYAVNEALFLSGNEEEILNGIVQNIRQEYQSNIDKFSQSIIISQIETLLNYSDRFYQRQFITRNKSNHQILTMLNQLLDNDFKDGELALHGLPAVQHIAERLNLSPGYLSNLLKVLTGQSTQQHIHDRLIEKAKEKLTTTDLTVSEIAYQLGFEHSQSFSKLFKSKTDVTPLEFRQLFN